MEDGGGVQLPLGAVLPVAKPSPLKDRAATTSLLQTEWVQESNWQAKVERAELGKLGQV